jgi:hypothetical protein
MPDCLEADSPHNFICKWTSMAMWKSLPHMLCGFISDVGATRVLSLVDAPFCFELLTLHVNLFSLC